MHLLRLEAHQFRNLTGAIDFAPGLNVLYGANAQGKSNWLEAVYLLATTKSFRTSHPRETINHEAKEALLRGAIAQGGLTKELQMLVTETSKQTFVNGKREAVTRYLGSFDAIAFTADEMEIVRGGPEARRRFIDRGIVGTMPAYLGTLAEYNRVLKQKNRLLRDASEADTPDRHIPQLQSWNDQVVRLGTEIHHARIAYVERLSAALNPQLFGCETIAIRYRSALEERGDLADYEKLLSERLALRLRNEIAVGYALVGPHRDELEILSDGFEIARYGSSGQQRSALLLLDLAQITVYNRVFDEYTVFLIDDIDAELDRTRIEILLDYLDGKSQTIVSTSKRSLADRYRNRATLRLIEGGKVTGRDMPRPETTNEMPGPQMVEQAAGTSEAPEAKEAPEEMDTKGTTETAEATSSEDLSDDLRHRAPF
jgi:DNA replication and repair protein RecF